MIQNPIFFTSIKRLEVKNKVTKVGAFAQSAARAPPLRKNAQDSLLPPKEHTPSGGRRVAPAAQAHGERHALYQRPRNFHHAPPAKNQTKMYQMESTKPSWYHLPCGT